MPQVAGVAKCISGNNFNNNGGAILGVTGTPGAPVDGISLTTNLPEQPAYGWKPTAAVSPSSSGNLGTQKLYNHLPFAYRRDGAGIISKVTSSLAGSGNTAMQTMSYGYPIRPIHKFYGYQRLNITSITMQGVASFGSNRGITVLASGNMNSALGQAADDAAPLGYGVPAEYVFIEGNPTPVQDDYPRITNP